MAFGLVAAGQRGKTPKPARSPSLFAQDSSRARCAQQQSGFLESKFPNPALATVCGLGKVSLTFVRLTFTPLRRFIKIGQGNFQSFGHPH